MPHDTRPCPRCSLRHNRNGAYCRSCHAAYMRNWRLDRPLTVEQRLRDNCRSYAAVYLRRGKIERKPCEECQAEPAQMHHSDYCKPLRIRWLCPPCHRMWHVKHRRRHRTPFLVPSSRVLHATPRGARLDVANAEESRR